MAQAYAGTCDTSLTVIPLSRCGAQTPGVRLLVVEDEPVLARQWRMDARCGVRG